ncbi:hypothetical protein K435DRAFT_965114 [Dendrothele bispora CBS 962.96]|uniref:Uncharacterized protein n=1 Tax=Dendrothele bispora (strain CBS 962.96) TaxID=1314807 RepID=A0A4S8M7F3_DENBC|nr:hypothetical protein K435DRAFT_965110 [Dendrothele bispora CBS 962.96]THU98070.1 hypothetical protein K435DRAFT_965114 [Dendrothele bispora CBS 962.96]
MMSRLLWAVGSLVEVSSSPLKGPVFVDSAQSPFLSTHQPTSEHPPASLPVSNPTKSFWTNTPNANPLANEGSQGALTKEADVCVIGFSDLFVGSGATGRNGGHLTPYSFFNFRNCQSQFGTEQAVKSLELEMRTAREMVKILEDERLEDKVDIVHGEHVGLISSEKAMRTAKSNYEGAKEAGLNVNDVEWLSAEEVKEVYGAPYPADNCRRAETITSGVSSRL